MAEQAVQIEKEVSASRTRQIILAFLAFILIGANDGALGVLLPSMQLQYGLDKGTVGLMFFGGTTGYLMAGVTSGLLVHKFGLRNFLVFGTGIFFLGAGLISQMPPFWLIVGGSVALGFGVATIDAGLNAYIASLPRNSALLNYLHAFYGVGALLGPLLATAVLTANLGWNVVYYLWAALYLTLSVVIRFVYPSGQVGESSHPEQGNVLAAALKLRVVWIGALFLMFYVGVEVSLGSWGFSFLTQVRDVDTVLAGWTISGYWMGLTLGRFFLARLAERVGDKRLIQGCLVGVVVGVSITWLSPTGFFNLAGIWLVGFCLGPIFPSTIALASRLVPSRLLASAIGFLASLGSLGAAFFPWLAGTVAQSFGLVTLLPYVIVLTVIMLGFWLVLQAPGRKVVE